MPEDVDLDFTGVFRVEELKLEPPPKPPAILPKDIVIGAAALKKGDCFISMAHARPTRRVDHAKTTILIVEDDTTTRTVLDLLLRKAGYLTRQASDAATFLAAIQKKPLPDVIILDVMLPGNVSGFKILGKIRSHPALRALPVIMLTGQSEIGDLMQAVSMGADAYLTKPAKLRALLDAVTAVLGG